MRSDDGKAGMRPRAAIIAFMASTLLTVLALWWMERASLDGEHARATRLAQEHAHAVQLNIEQALSATYALAGLIKLGNGNIEDFDTAAGVMLTFYPGASALELAPDGIVQKVVPLAGNEGAIGHNLLKDSTREKEAFAARDTRRLTLAGPFKLVQGGTGAAGRLPVFLDGEDGSQRFWGFIIVLLRFPEALKPAHLDELKQQGYEYALWRIHPDTRERHVIASSSTTSIPNETVDVAIEVPNAAWVLSVWRPDGWIDRQELYARLIVAILFVGAMTGVAWRWQRGAV